MKKLALYALIAGVMICSSFGTAKATVTTITICNKGDIPVHIAYVEQEQINYGNVSVAGWYKANPDECTGLLTSRSKGYYFAFLVKGGYVTFMPQELPSAILPANEAYCVNRKDAFSYSKGSGRKLICKDGYELAPFWMQFHVGIPTQYSSYGQENQLHETIDIAPSKGDFTVQSKSVPRKMQARRRYVNTIVNASKNRTAAIGRTVWNNLLNIDKGLLGSLVEDYQQNQGPMNKILRDTQMDRARPDMSDKQEEKYVNDILKRLRKDSGE